MKGINLSNNPLFDLVGIESFPNLIKITIENIEFDEAELFPLSQLK